MTYDRGRGEKDIHDLGYLTRVILCLDREVCDPCSGTVVKLLPNPRQQEVGAGYVLSLLLA